MALNILVEPSSDALPNLKVQRIKLLFSSSNTADGFLGDYRLTYPVGTLWSALNYGKASYLTPSLSRRPVS